MPLPCNESKRLLRRIPILFLYDAIVNFTADMNFQLIMFDGAAPGLAAVRGTFFQSNCISPVLLE